MSPRKKIIIAVWVFVALSVLAIIGAIIYRVTQGPMSRDGEQTVSTDATTGETVIRTEGKAPEISTTDGVLILGLTKIIDYGVGSFQVTLARNAFVEFAKEQTSENTIERISLDPNGLRNVINQETGETTITGEVVINQKTRQRVSLSYIGTNDMLVTIYDRETDEILFSSSRDAH